MDLTKTQIENFLASFEKIKEDMKNTSKKSTEQTILLQRNNVLMEETSQTIKDYAEKINEILKNKDSKAESFVMQDFSDKFVKQLETAIRKPIEIKIKSMENIKKEKSEDVKLLEESKAVLLKLNEKLQKDGARISTLSKMESELNKIISGLSGKKDRTEKEDLLLQNAQKTKEGIEAKKENTRGKPSKDAISEMISGLNRSIDGLSKNSPKSEMSTSNNILNRINNSIKNFQIQQQRNNEAVITILSKVNSSIKEIKKTNDSDTEEGGLRKEDSNTKIQEIMSKYFSDFHKKLTDTLKKIDRKSGKENLIKEKDDEEGGSLIGKIFKLGALVAGLAIIWGNIKNNPMVKEMISDMFTNIKRFFTDPENVEKLKKIFWGLADFFNEHVTPLLQKYIWIPFKDGIMDGLAVVGTIGAAIGAFKLTVWGAVTGLKALGGLAVKGLTSSGGFIARQLGSLIMKGVSLIGLPGIIVGTLGVAAVAGMKKFGDAVIAKEEARYKIAEQTGILEENIAKKKRERLEEEAKREGYSEERVKTENQRITLEKNLQELQSRIFQQQQKIDNDWWVSDEEKKLLENMKQQELQLLNRLIKTKKELAIEEAIHNARKVKQPEIEKKNQRFLELQAEMKMTNFSTRKEAMDALFDPNNKLTEDQKASLRKIIRESNKQWDPDNPMLKPAKTNGPELLANAEKEAEDKRNTNNQMIDLLKLLNEKMDENTQVAIEGHTLNAQVVAASKPNPSVTINAPQPSHSSPASTRNLAGNFNYPYHPYHG